MKYLESQLTKLCEHQMTTDTKHANLKKENGQLTEKYIPVVVNTVVNILDTKYTEVQCDLFFIYIFFFQMHTMVRIQW